MVVYSGSFALLVTGWQDHGALGRFARGLWDTAVGPGRGWSYSEYIKILSAGLEPYGGQVERQPARGGLEVVVYFQNPADYTLFCLRLG